MNTTTKIVAGIILVLALIGAYYFPQSTMTTQTIGAISAVGTTNSSQRLATVVLALSTTLGTTTGITNTDSQDRAIQNSYAYCTGIGTSNAWNVGGTGGALAALLIQMSTSTASGNAGSNTNFASNLTVATATPFVFVSSTTVPTPNDVGRYWPAGTVLNVTANATNTGTCVIGINYLSL